MPTQKEKQAQEQREAILKDGLYAVTESGDNSVEVSNTGYVGASPEYQNAAYPQDLPLNSEDEEQAKIEEDARKREEEVLAEEVGFRGFKPNTPHPSEAKGPAQDLIDLNRKIMENQAAPAPVSAPEENGEQPPPAPSMPSVT